MRDADNIRELAQLMPDFMGFIFYEGSPRHVKEKLLFEAFPYGIKRVGVFVNPTMDQVREKIEEYHLDLIQLHGEETAEEVENFRIFNLPVIKAIPVTDHLPIEELDAFDGKVDYFLFDTKTRSYGGSGKKFNWDLLSDYKLKTPFFLSGGVDLDDIPAIRDLDLDQLYAIDVNSRFEVEPGLKDIVKIKQLMQRL